MAEAGALMTAWLNVGAEHEEEFNAWYDTEHLPQVVALPGFLTGRRYACEGAAPKYLAWYDTADETVEPGSDLKQYITDKNAFESPQGLTARKTPWTEKMRSHFQNTRRSMCRLILPSVHHDGGIR